MGKPGVKIRDYCAEKEIEFSGGFADLHVESYREILSGRGFKLEDVRPCIETVAAIRTKPIELLGGEQHPFLANLISNDERYLHGWPA